MLNNLPPDFAQIIQNTNYKMLSEGESDAEVFRLDGEQARYLKVSRITAQYPVKADYERLRWLSGKIVVPEILHYSEDDSQQYLLMSDCAGLHPLHDDLAWTVQDRIQLLASAAQNFHALSIENCPYRMSFDDQIALAKKNMEQGRVDDKNQARSIENLFAEFVSLKPDTEDWVLTHGDLYPVNIRVDEATHEITGFIDVGAMAIADRYTDLAPIVNAIGWHCEPLWIDRFFDLYGVALNRDKLRFYQLFQEFL